MSKIINKWEGEGEGREGMEATTTSTRVRAWARNIFPPRDPGRTEAKVDTRPDKYKAARRKSAWARYAIPYS
jgi:hypothetical protein